MSKVITYCDPMAPELDFLNSDQWISNSAYLEVVKKTIITCTDIVLYKTNDRAIYLAKRSVLPMLGIWCFGGRMFFNDHDPEASAARCLKTETGLELNPQRFEFIRTNLCLWAKVAQGDFPGKNLVMVYGCAVTEAEIKQMAQGLAWQEYDRDFGIQRFDFNRLTDCQVHPALVDIYKQLFSGELV